ncbi:aspartate transaminase aat1 [Saitozyma podzolica]|uniref:Aspartate aminotransferase n=1 Tax=Saitozyma podzolica TaxID=1890683 RepID=A0A427Y7P0_9TREE|nr:aspartate transaminase aat1 [Saitozyma podzolica]
MSITNFWAGVPQGPPDPILGVTDAFKKDTAKNKVNLGVGAYRDEQGKPYVLESVLQAEDILHKKKLDKEYLPITGEIEFVRLSAELAYGKDSKPLTENRIAVAQSISGTGALRIATEFLAKYYPGPKSVYLPDPTWGNHIPLVEGTGMKVVRYRYFDKKTIGLDFAGMKEDLEKAEPGSIILLHACAQNPSGIDPTKEQWKEINEVIKSKKHLALFDMAYQGFASGDLIGDAFAPRYFVEQGHQIILCQSFAKNLGLYGERAGTFSMVCSSPEEKERVLSQVKRVIRPLYSSPPLHGAQLVATILGTPELFEQWLKEVKKMADRIISMREKLYNALVELKTPGEWGHIKSQIGMFSFTGMTADQVSDLAEYAHVYLTKDGRISMAGLNEGNIQYFAESMSKAVKGELKPKSSL